MNVVISHILPRFLIFPKKLIVRHSFFIERLSKLGCWKCFITKNQSFWLITLFLCYGNNPISLKNQTCHENKLGLIVPLLNHSPNYKEFRAKRSQRLSTFKFQSSAVFQHRNDVIFHSANCDM